MSNIDINHPAHVDIDVYYEIIDKPNEYEDFYNTLRFFEVEYEVLKHDGPAGGNPLVRFNGTYHHLTCIISELFGAISYDADINNDHVEFLNSFIVLH